MLYKVLVKEIGLILSLLLIVFLLNPYSLYPFVGYLLIFYLLILRRNLFFEVLDFEFLTLLAFCFSYSAFYYFSTSGVDRGIQLIIIEAIFPFFFYALGKCLVTSKMSYKHILIFIFFLVISFSSTALATIIKDIVKGGFAQINRDFSSIWGGRLILATGLAGFLIYNTTFLIFVISRNKLLNSFEKILLLAIFSTTLICAFRLGSRTILALSALSLLYGFFFQLRVLTPKNKFIFILQIGIISSILIYFVPTYLESDIFSTLGHRLREGTSSNSSAGGRTELWSDAFSKIFSHPLGWDSKKYGHNMWLDTARVSGSISLFFLLVFTFFTLRNTKRILYKTKIDSSLKLCFALFTLISLVFFFGEPILLGDINSFIFFCLLQGILKRTIELNHG